MLFGAEAEQGTGGGGGGVQDLHQHKTYPRDTIVMTVQKRCNSIQTLQCTVSLQSLLRVRCRHRRKGVRTVPSNRRHHRNTIGTGGPTQTVQEFVSNSKATQQIAIAVYTTRHEGVQHAISMTTPQLNPTSCCSPILPFANLQQNCKLGTVKYCNGARNRRKLIQEPRSRS